MNNKNQAKVNKMVDEINRRFEINSAKAIPYINNYFISLPTKFLSLEYMRSLIEICGEESAIGVMPALGNTLMIRTFVPVWNNNDQTR